MKDIPAIVQSQMAKRIALYGQKSERMAFIIGLHAGLQYAWEVTEPTEVKL